MGNLYELNPAGGGTGPLLKFQGSFVTAGQYGAAVTPVGVKQTGSGYEVAWSVAGANDYVVWNVDSNGNYTSSAASALTGGSAALTAVEADFGEVFPGAGAAASTATIVSNGTTSLVQVSNLYELNPAGGGTGPLLEYQGSVVTVGEFGTAVTPVGAVQTSNGYQVAWDVANANQYLVWNTDSNGNYTSTATGLLAGSSYALEQLELAFNEVFPGVPIAVPTTIATNGVTSLVQISNQYALENSGGSIVAWLNFQGSPVTAGEFGAAVTPVGAAQTANGYEVAWSVTGADEFIVWNTDASGNFTSDATGILAGTSTALEAVETNFGEVFPDAGPIASTSTIASNGTTSLVRVGNLYELNPASGGTGPLLEYQGGVVTAGEFGSAVTPAGAKQTANGYEVAWSIASANEFIIWNTDANGDYTRSATGALAGSSNTVAGLEANFGEVFPGAGSAASGTTIASNGTTALVQVGNLFELNPVSGGTGPLLQYQGSVVTAGQFGSSVTPVGAKQTGNGYEVAWSVTGSNQYVVWNTDLNGNYTTSATGMMSAASAALEAVETNFGEVFAGAGPIASTTTIETNGTTTLVQVGNLYALNAASGAAGPLLEYQGSAVSAGQFGSGIAPVAAAQTATGYLVAWSVGTDQYVVWNTDRNGNFTSAATGTVSGESFAFEDLEPAFGKDLNSDGRLSAVLVTSPGTGTTVDLSAQSQAETINLGSNTAVASAGLNAPSIAFIGTPDAIILGSSANTIEYALAPASGIETITNFVPGQDELNIDLMGAANTMLQIYDTTVGGVNAVAIASSADPTHGVVLLNAPAGASYVAQLAADTTFAGGHALIG